MGHVVESSNGLVQAKLIRGILSKQCEPKCGGTGKYLW